MKKMMLFAVVLVMANMCVCYAQCVQCSGSTTLGTDASRLGTSTVATGEASFASGYYSDATADYATAIGYNAFAAGIYSFALGKNVYAQDTAFAFGKDITVSGLNSFVIGSGYSSSAMLVNNIPQSIMIGVGSSTPAMTIRQNSNHDFMPYVGVGTTDPKKELHINGNVMISGTDKALLFATSPSSNSGDLGIKYISNSGLKFYLPNMGLADNTLFFIKTNGYVGVGTDSPTANFEVIGTSKATALASETLTVAGDVVFSDLAGVGTKALTVNSQGYLSSADFSTFHDNMGSHTATQNINLNGFKIINNRDAGGIFVDTSNYVGLGTDIPHQMLHVAGGNILVSRLSSRSPKAPGSTNGSILFGDVTSNQYPYGSWGIEFVDNNNEGYGLNFWKTSNSNGGTLNNVLFLSDETQYCGNVGIRTNKPVHELSVNGTVQAKEVIVTTSANDWPDYVFKPDYKLPGLQELGKCIKDEGHLPGVPSADEIGAEGIKVGEMNAMLLQKIEELTLYVIELQKQIDELKTK